ncbi:MAG: FAD-dependent oxidoreductase [Corallococcus sp.]|nr:FAD-dependent oxidoreductase [Bacillota bacterium]MCM1533100.1 FAD-dependent oxidoreductase [Corallococcus sp.]
MYDVIVVGGGPAGLTASLYAARAGKSVLILESNAFGGQIATAPRVENFPSVKEVAGARLANDMFEQAIAHGVEFDMGTATVETAESGFTVTTEYGAYFTKAVVLATGVSHKKLGVPSEDKFAGKGLCYCAVCDGAFYKDKPVCVVGDGNSAAQYALFLSEICSSVCLLTLFDRLFCDKELIDRIVASDKIEWVKNVKVKDVVGDDKVKGVTYQDCDGAITYADCDAVFVAIGQEPRNDSFKDLVKLDEKGYVVASEDCRASCDGVFAAGDCRTKKVRQCATAVGDGATAGFFASMYVDKLNAKQED